MKKIQKKIYLILAACIIWLFFCGCAKKTITVSKTFPVVIESQADQAFKQHDWVKAKILYKQLVSNPHLSPDKKRGYLKRLVLSAFRSKDFLLVKKVLEQLFALYPESQKDPKFQKIYILVLKQSGLKNISSEYLLRFCLSPDTEWELKEQAIFLCCDLFISQHKYSRLVYFLKEVYQHLKDAEKIVLEEKLFSYLQQIASDDIKRLEEEVNTSREFPENVILFSSIYSLSLKNPQTWSSNYSKLISLTQNLVSPLFKSLVSQLKEQFGVPNREFVLLLPLSGPYAPFGWKIFKGASLAQWQLVSEGAQITVKVINSCSSQWERELQNTSAQIIGGPIQLVKIKQIFQDNLEEQKIFFVFSPQVKEEGLKIWRFFPSSRDQVKALIRTCKQQLNVSKFAVLYPAEKYGHKMASLFANYASNSNATLTALLSYPPDNPSIWGSKVSQLLGIDLNKYSKLALKENKIFPEPDFEAVFIPDSFSRVRLLVPYFFYYNEPRLYFLGPSLWNSKEQLSPLEKNYFALCFYPGAWWDNNPSFAAQHLQALLKESLQGKADFWIALGFDFVRFFATFPELNEVNNPQNINALLQKTTTFDWSMAPLHWTKQGIAYQDLFLFNKLTGNKELIDFKKLKKIRARRVRLRERQKLAK
ncbi:MAG: penicillin-binding protein activator [Desulfonauticus sp.]|nr:penicillin-binding protein activator [Desulfonauticus sp.]